MKKFSILLLTIITLFGCNSQRQNEKKHPGIIPVPQRMEMGKGKFKITGSTDIILGSSDPVLKSIAEGINQKISGFTGRELDIRQFDGKQPRNTIFLKIDESLMNSVGKEGYKMSVKPSGVEISAPNPAGIFYGVQTIYQLLPPEVWGNPKNFDSKAVLLDLPCLEITDFPQFSWRGMHLDVSRHFFPKEFVKKYIDLIAMHKMNVFHWHLTDDNGWRIEIDRYPKLTEVAAWRADREDQEWDKRSQQRPGEKATYGGFYTKEDIREIVQYASERFITVVPEIEMPGHTSEVFAAYPEFSCSGEKTTVQTGSYWPVENIFCAGKEGTFTFIENVLDEVIELFPSEYIHIGGDEADKTAWKKCPDCQKRIRQEGLSGENELQSYFVKRIERYLVSKGRKMIGWDEILQGGLAPEATVMSWQGFEGGIEAANQGHAVVMCPTSYCYFDYYQADPEFQPKAIGGLITLQKVYSFRPIPSELKGEQRNLILGGQGNLWTEYVPTPEHAEYMVLPRMTALAEVLWSPEVNLDWNDFRERLQTQFRRFDHMNVNYSRGSGKVMASALFNVDDRPYSIKLETEVPGTEIVYTLNGNAPALNSFKYKKPVKIDHDVTLKAQAVQDNKKIERAAEYKVNLHYAIGQPVKYLVNYSERYTGGGDNALNDGLRGSLNFNDGYWQGFNGTNMDVIIQSKEDMVFKAITSTFLLDQKKWIFIPDTVNVYISLDGDNFQKLASLTHKIPLDNEKVLTNDFSIKLSRPMKARAIRIEAINIGTCPDWHPGKGQKAWIFADEILVK